MARIRLTQVFPSLLPLRKWQRITCMHIAMRFDGTTYAIKQADAPLPYKVVQEEEAMINTNSGYDIVYQRNKADNLHLSSLTVHRLLIAPGETFSFWHAMHRNPYPKDFKKGLCLVNDRMTYVEGGGLCQLSNTLYWLFMHTPLTVTERHPHSVESVRGSHGKRPRGCDATISEGWLDLKVRNDTSETYQIEINFVEDNMITSIHCSKPLPYTIQIEESACMIKKDGNKVFQHVTLTKHMYDKETGACISDTQLPIVRSEIKYPIEEEEETVC